jgi:Uma2 family endonuclease
MSVARQEKKLMTAEELWTMPEVPGKRFELINGEVVEVPGAGGLHSLIAALLYELIRDVVRKQQLGWVFPDGAGFIIKRDPDIGRIPDVAFITGERMPGGRVPEGFVEAAPDLAVEAVSPNDNANEVREKVREYLEAGVRLVWVLWPRFRSVSVYSADGSYGELGAHDELDGGKVLPGFRVKVEKLFEIS